MLAFDRRTFLRSAVASSALFPALVAELLADDVADPLAPKKPHFRAEGEVGHLPVHERRRLARRFVRPQAEAVADHGKTVTLDHPETRNRPGYEKLFLKRPHGSSSRAASAAPRSATCSRTSASASTTCA